MRGLRRFCEPFAEGAAGDRALQQLQCGYRYVQLAVEEGHVEEVLSALRSLLHRT